MNQLQLNKFSGNENHKKSEEVRAANSSNEFSNIWEDKEDGTPK